MKNHLPPRRGKERNTLEEFRKKMKENKNMKTIV